MIHNITSSLTLVIISAGGEENTESSLEVDALAGAVLSAGLDTVIEDESAGLGVEHVSRSSVHEPGDHLECDQLLGTLSRLLT